MTISKYSGELIRQEPIPSTSVHKQKQGFLSSLARDYLILHIVCSLSGVYTFVPELVYGLNVFQYMAFFLVFWLSINPNTMKRVMLLVPFGFVVILYYSIALVSTPHLVALWKVGFGHAVILCTLLFSVPVAIRDDISWRRFAFLVQIMAIVAFCICIAEVTNPIVAKYLALGVTTGSTGDVVYHAFRPGGLMRNPNDLATFFIFTFLLSFWCPTSLRQAGRIVSLFGVYLSASRGGAIILALCIFFIGAGLLRYRLTLSLQASLRLVGVLLFSCLLFVTVYLMIYPKVLTVKSDMGQSRKERILSLNDKSGAAGRFALWQYWMPFALDAPLLGEGLYSFQGGIYSPPSRSINDNGTHNMWIMLLGEVGFLGPLAYLAIVLLGLLRIVRGREHPMDRLVFLLLWSAFVLLSFKGHNQLEHRHWIVVMALIQYTPWLNNFCFKDKQSLKRIEPQQVCCRK